MCNNPNLETLRPPWSFFNIEGRNLESKGRFLPYNSFIGTEHTFSIKPLEMAYPRIILSAKSEPESNQKTHAII